MSDTTRLAVWLYDRHVGWLFHHDNYSWFEFCDEYLDSIDRPVLGLRFEERPRARFGSNVVLPPWFSNLLPEGVLRTWIAAARDVAPQREVELLAQVGHDLAGAVRVLPDGQHPVPDIEAVLESASTSPARRDPEHQPWKFSLAGVGLKFSMLRDGAKFTCTATGEGGDWIVKLPDSRFAGVPHNEFVMMRFAAAVGIEVPDVTMVHRDDIAGLPARVWPGDEEYAYAVRRFDRGADRGLVHIEDFAQIRGVYPAQKYDGNFETVAALSYRGRDTTALHEFVRRLVFFVLIGNGDAHLKNWSLIYRDRRVPTLSPAYDIMATEPYEIGPDPEDLGMKFAGSRRFDTVRVHQFGRLAQKLRTTADLQATALSTIERAQQVWPRFADELGDLPVRASVHATLTSRAGLLSRGT